MHWSACFLPDDYADEQQTVRCGDGFPITGGFASFMPKDAEYAIEVFREAHPAMRCRELRFEPEHYIPARRQRPSDPKR